MDQPQATARGSYAPRQPVTDEDRLRLDAALEQTKGHRGQAAELLGLPETRVNNVVQHTPWLRAKWGRSIVPKPVEGTNSELNREPPLAPMSDEDFKAVEAIRKQDALLQKGWKALGFTPEQKQFLHNLQVNYSTNLKGTIDLTYGGMVHAYTRLLFVFEDVLKRIQEVDDNPEAFDRVQATKSGENIVKTAHEHRCELYDRLVAISAEIRKVNSDATKANWVRAQLERLKTDEGKNAKRKKEGWSARKVSPVKNDPITPAPPPDMPDDDPESTID